MQVTVRFSGLLRSLAGTPSLTLSLDEGSTLRDLLRTLRDTLPPPFVEQVVAPLETDEGPLALLLLNRKHLQKRDRLDHPLEDGDVVAFVMPMTGGKDALKQLHLTRSFAGISFRATVGSEESRFCYKKGDSSSLRSSG